MRRIRIVAALAALSLLAASPALADDPVTDQMVMLPDELVGQLYTDAKEQLEALARELPSVSVTEETLSSERPSDAICSAAESAGAALIVVGSHSRRGIERLLIGSNAERVVRHAPCSVLICR